MSAHQPVPYHADLYAEIAKFASERNHCKEYNAEEYSKGYTLSYFNGQVVVSSIPWMMYGLVIFKARADAEEAAQLFGHRILAQL